MCKAHGDNLNKEWVQENISEDTDVTPGDHHTAVAAVVVKTSCTRDVLVQYLSSSYVQMIY